MALRITLGDLLHECAEKFGERPFLIIAETGEALTYREFEVLTNSVAHGLLENYSDALSYVDIFLENSAEYLAISYALKKVNAIEVSINPAMRDAPLARMIDQTGTKLLFTSSQQLSALDQIRDLIPNVQTLIMLDGVDEARSLFPELEIVCFEEILSSCEDHIVSPAKDTDVATILFRSEERRVG